MKPGVYFSSRKTSVQLQKLHTGGTEALFKITSIVFIQESFQSFKRMTTKGQSRGTPSNRNDIYIITIPLHFTLLIKC